MAIVISTAARNAGVKAITSLIDQGRANAAGYLEIRGNPRPADPQTSASGALLATLVLSYPAFAVPFNGLQNANQINSDLSADSTGTATWFRVYDRDGNAVFDGDVSAIGGNGDIQFDNPIFTAGQVVAVSGFSVNLPGAC